jgi:hypothetical protein
MTCNPGRIDDPINLAMRDAAPFDTSQEESYQRVADCASPVLVSIDLRQEAFLGFA